MWALVSQEFLTCYAGQKRLVLVDMPDTLDANTKKRSLRWGYTTGTSAAAAAKAALLRILGHPSDGRVSVRLPGYRTLDVPLQGVLETGPVTSTASVIKDGGDDPDCTHGAEIRARVELVKGLGKPLSIRGGRGVGVVTRPGLSLPPGQWAINPVPRKMIAWAVEDALLESSVTLGTGQGVAVEIIVPRGEELAKETLNPRLGIMGGISILGTTGLVKPFSHGAYRATIHTALRAARANGVNEIFLVTGSQTEGFARALNPGYPEIAFCQMADYVKFTMEWVARLGFSSAQVYAFFGKALKIAQGLPQTHASQGSIDLAFLAELAPKIPEREHLREAVSRANTARHALQIIKETGEMDVISRVGELALNTLKVYTKKDMYVIFTLLDFDGKILWQGD